MSGPSSPITPLGLTTEVGNSDKRAFLGRLSRVEAAAVRLVRLKGLGASEESLQLVYDMAALRLKIKAIDALDLALEENKKKPEDLTGIAQELYTNFGTGPTPYRSQRAALRVVRNKGLVDVYAPQAGMVEEAALAGSEKAKKALDAAVPKLKKHWDGKTNERDNRHTVKLAEKYASAPLALDKGPTSSNRGTKFVKQDDAKTWDSYELEYDPPLVAPELWSILERYKGMGTKDSPYQVKTTLKGVGEQGV